MNIQDMEISASDAADFLRTLSHRGRLLILCHLIEGESAVLPLAKRLKMRQTTLSQHLARLRKDGLVRYRREGQTLYYSIADERAQRLLKTLYELFCAEDKKVRREQTAIPLDESAKKADGNIP